MVGRLDVVNRDRLCLSFDFGVVRSLVSPVPDKCFDLCNVHSDF